MPDDARGFDHVDAHHRVVVKKAAGIFAIGADAADDRGQVNEDVRARIVIEP